jgi:hypothetical protein
MTLLIMNDTQYKDTKHNNCQHNWLNCNALNIATLSVLMLSVAAPAINFSMVTGIYKKYFETKTS